MFKEISTYYAKTNISEAGLTYSNSTFREMRNSPICAKFVLSNGRAAVQYQANLTVHTNEFNGIQTQTGGAMSYIFDSEDGVASGVTLYFQANKYININSTGGGAALLVTSTVSNLYRVLSFDQCTFSNFKSTTLTNSGWL